MRRTTRIVWVLPVVAIAASAAGFGLVAARESPSPPPPEVMFGCIHRWDSTWDCPEFNPQNVKWVLTEDVEEIEIILHLRSGETRRWTHPMYTGAEETRNVDAVFFTEPAVWDIWFSYLRARTISEDSIRKVLHSLPRRTQ